MATPRHPLFVYGTLLAGEVAHTLLVDSLERIEPGLLSGADMYSLGAYPMLIDGSGKVAGEVCWLTQNGYSKMLVRLDLYEGPEYTRQLRGVTVNGQDVVTAWVYVGAEVPAAARLLPCGDWRQRISADPS